MPSDLRQRRQKNRKAATRPQILSNLNFGIWASLFGPKSHHLWQSLRPIFQAKGVQRGVIARDLRDLRILRNRVAHYEPIIALPLAQRYASITTLTGWLSPSAATWIAKYSRSEENTSELQTLMRNSYAVFCLHKKKLQHTF